MNETTFSTPFPSSKLLKAQNSSYPKPNPCPYNLSQNDNITLEGGILGEITGYMDSDPHGMEFSWVWP